MADPHEIASLPEKNKNWLIFLAGLAVIIVFLVANIEVPPQIDDAYISYRYARNLAHGHGLVYNIGERVEGFTNMLWTLMIAAGIWLGFDPPFFSHLLALLSSAALLGTTFGFAYRTCPRWYALLALVLLVCSAPFAVWSLSGLETPLYAALAVGAFWAAYEQKWWLAGVLAGLCFWTRPDGGLVGLCIFAVGWKLCENKKQWRRGLWTWLLFLTLLTAFRWAYYGRLVPNTFQAKVGGIPWAHGLRYVKTFYISGPVFALLLALAGLKDRRLWPVFLFVFAHTAYVLVIGGDAFSYSRFFVPLLPLILVAALSASQNLSRWKRSIALVGVVVLWALSSEYIPWLKTEAYTSKLAARKKYEKGGRRDANKFACYDGPIARVDIGNFGYHYPGRVLDMLGLISPPVAKKKGNKGFLLPGHQASNPDWILQQRPDVICIDKDRAFLPCQIELLEHPGLKRHYTEVGHVFVRKDLVSSKKEAVASEKAARGDRQQREADGLP